jgi:hypothetical protein
MTAAKIKQLEARLAWLESVVALTPTGERKLAERRREETYARIVKACKGTDSAVARAMLTDRNNVCVFGEALGPERMIDVIASFSDATQREGLLSAIAFAMPTVPDAVRLRHVVVPDFVAVAPRNGQPIARTSFPVFDDAQRSELRAFGWDASEVLQDVTIPYVGNEPFHVRAAEWKTLARIVPQVSQLYVVKPCDAATSAKALADEWRRTPVAKRRVEVAK